MRNDFKLRLLQDKEIYEYCIEQMGNNPVLKNNMPLGNDIYESENQLNDIIRSKSWFALSHDLEETNIQNKLILSNNLELARKVLSDGLLNLDYSDEVINNIFEKIVDVIENNNEIISSKMIDNKHLNEKLQRKLIPKYIDKLIPIISKNEVIRLYNSYEECQLKIYNSSIFKEIYDEMKIYQRIGIIEKTKVKSIKTELLLKDIDKYLMDYMGAELIKELDYDIQNQLMKKIINGELRCLNISGFLLNIDERLMNEYFKTVDKEKIENILDGFSLENKLEMLTRPIDIEFKQIITKQIKTLFLENRVRSLELQNKKYYQLLFEIISDEELYNVISSYEISRITFLLNIQNEKIAQMSKDIFIKELNDTETLDLMTMNINLNNFSKEIKIEILKKLPIKQLIEEMGKDADIDNYIIQKLKTNKEMFDDIDDSIYFSGRQIENIINNQELYGLLPDKLKLECYSFDIDEKLKKEMLEILKKDNSLIDYITIDEYIINNLSNDEILDLCYNATNFYMFLVKIKDEKLLEQILDIYESKEYKKSITWAFRDIKNEKIKCRMIETMKMSDLIELLKKDDYDEIVFTEIIKRQQDLEISDINGLLNDIPYMKTLQIIDNLSVKSLFNILENISSKQVEEKIMNYFNQDPTILKDASNLVYVLINLNEDNKKIIEDKVKEDSKKYLSGYNLLDKIPEEYIINLAPIIYNMDKYKDKIGILEYLQEKNMHLFLTFNNILLEDDILNVGIEIIEKLARYPEITGKINIMKNLNTYDLFLQIINTYKNDDFGILMEKIVLLTYELANKESKKLIQVIYTNDELQQLSNYFLKKSYNGIYEKERINFSSIAEYNKNKKQYFNKRFKSVGTLKEKKDIFLKEYFSMNLRKAEYIVNEYIGDIDNILVNQYIIDYINSINEIINCTEEELEELYNKQEDIFEIDEVIFIEHEIKKAYTNEIRKTTNELDNYETTRMIINDTEVNKLPYEFNLIVHSTDAYGSMTMINDNYNDSWNLSNRVKNHGICCTFITNRNLGIPAVKNKGILIGFKDFHENSINAMAPYDLHSVNDNVETTTIKPSKYLVSENIPKNTRHTHNEIVIERKELRREYQKNNTNIQPDYILVTSDMDKEIFENAKKASIELAKDGKTLPIYYIDKEEIYENERKKIIKKVSEFQITRNLKMLEEIIDIYESNRCGSIYSFKPKMYKFDEYINVEFIEKIIYEYIETEDNNENLGMIINILKNENNKFEQIKDLKQRKATFNIDIDGIESLVVSKVNGDEYGKQK